MVSCSPQGWLSENWRLADLPIVISDRSSSNVRLVIGAMKVASRGCASGGESQATWMNSANGPRAEKLSS